MAKPYRRLTQMNADLANAYDTHAGLYTPRGLAVGAKAVWVTNAADGTVSEVDLKQLKVIQTIGVGEQVSDAAVAGGRVWVATGIDNGLVQIDERSGGVLGTLRLSSDRSASAHSVAAGAGA